MVSPQGNSRGGNEETVGGLDDAVSLLERHFARVDPVQAMSLLPPEVPVQKLMTFLGSSIRHADARRRNSQVMTSGSVT